MANLLDALRSPGMADTTSQLSTLLRAKTGKAVGGPATALSTQQEQAAVAQTQQAMAPVREAATMQQAGQQQQAREIEQRAAQQQAQIAQTRQSSELKAQLDASRLLQQLEQGRTELDVNKYKSTLEQLGQNLRLSNKEYIDNLEREGARARLNDKLQFEEQITRSILQDNKNLLERQLGNKSILQATDREFDIAMERMGLQTAMDFVRNELKADAERTTATGIGTIITTGIGAYGKYSDSEAAGLKRSQDLATSERQSSTSDLARMRSMKGE